MRTVKSQLNGIDKALPQTTTCEPLERRVLLSAIGAYSGAVHLKGNSASTDFAISIDSPDANGGITGAMSIGADRFSIFGTMTGHSILAVFQGPSAVGEIKCSVGRTSLHGRLIETAGGTTTTGSIKAVTGGPGATAPDAGPATGSLNEANVLGQHAGSRSFGGHKHSVLLNISDESNDGLLTGSMTGADTASFAGQGVIWGKHFIFILDGSTGAGNMLGTLTHAQHLRGSVVSVSSSGEPHGHFDLTPQSTVSHFDHIVVVMEENHSYDQILGPSATDDPYLQSLAAGGASFTNSHSIRHASLPNYLALFSGSTQGVADNTTPDPVNAPNLATELAAAGLSFAGYAESLPSAGYSGDDVGDYARRHNPWVDFGNVPASANLPFSDFPSDFSTLPTVSFVVPNLQHDMHDGTIAQADQWLSDNLGGYANWAQTHNSLIIVTWDEDDGSTDSNQIPTIFSGQHITPGQDDQSITHYDVLRTIEAAESLPPLGKAAYAQPIDIFG